MSRRLRFESTWNGSTGVTNSTVRYVYDGNVVIQERDGNNVPLVTYTRGADLSGGFPGLRAGRDAGDLRGRFQGAGRIGGLLARTDSAGTTAFYHADGNGNVTCRLEGIQTVVAQYLYDPYGNLLSAVGALASTNLYRFSSKEYHPSSGLVYYLYRFYDPNLPRWVNRDPLGEGGGLNVHTFTYATSQSMPRIRSGYRGRLAVPFHVAATEVTFRKKGRPPNRRRGI